MNHSTVLAAAMAMGLAFHAQATDFYWIGGESSEWANGSNWSLTEGGEAANAYPNGGEDTAFFPSGATLTLNSYAKVRKIFTDGTLTLAGNGNGGIQTVANNNTAPLTIGGTGLIRLAGVNIIAPYATNASGARTEITNAIEIVEGTTNIFRIATGSSRYSSLHVRGALSGSGTLIVRSNTDSDSYQAYFYGDASAFAGVFCDRMEGDTNATRINIASPAALSPLATYNLTAPYEKAGNNYILRVGGAETTYQVGALNGEVHFDGNNNSKDTQKFGYTLEIGGKNEDCSFGGTLARPSYPSYTKKVGTADMTFTGSQMPNLTIESGTYIVGASTALPGEMIFTGGAFSVAEGVSVNPPANFSASSTSAVVFDDRGLQNTWSGALTDARVPYGFTKKGAGTLTLTTAPTHTTLTTIEDGTLVVPQGTTIAALSLAGGKLTVPLAGTEDETEVLTISSLADGTTVEDLTAAVTVAGVTVSVEFGASGYVVKASRTAQTFTWTGAADTAWETGANWTVGGVAASAAPLAIDTVSFPSALGDKTNVVLSARATVAEVIADSDVALSGAQICSPMYRGDGKLILGENAGFYVNAATVVSNALEIAGDVAVTPSTTYIATRFYGDLTGSGTLTLGGERPTYEFAGNNSGFEGTISAPKDSNDRNAITLSSVSAGSSNAIWEVYSSGAGDFTSVQGGVFMFGSLSGAIAYSDQSNKKYQTIEVGHLGLDDTLDGRWFNSSYIELVVDSSQDDKTDNNNRGHCLRKVGNGTLSFGGKYLRKYEINGGTLLITADEAFVWTKGETTYRSRFSFGGGTLAFGGGVSGDPSSRIVSSSSPICFSNGVNEVHTWASALAASNVGGLTKLGAGTLTLSAAPKYTGWTTVKAGKLIVPEETSLDVVIGAGGEIEGATTNNLEFAQGYTFNTASDSAIVATGAADVANLTVYIANPASAESITIVRAGSVTGTPTLAFPAGTSEKVKAKWSLRSGNGTLKASSVVPFAIIVR